MIQFRLKFRFVLQGRLHGLLSREQCAGKAVQPGQLLLQGRCASSAFDGQTLGRARRRLSRFQPRGHRRGFPFLLPQHRLEGFGFFPRPIDFGVRSIFYRPNVCRLRLALGGRRGFVCVERLGDPVAHTVFRHQ